MKINDNKTDYSDLNIKSIYQEFGKYYDALYDHFINYQADCDFLEEVFNKYLPKRSKDSPVSILDLGCGTGNFTIGLAKRGYLVIGIDISATSLAVAHRKFNTEPELRNAVHLIKQDLRNAEYKIKFDAIIAMFGVFSYLPENSDLGGIFSNLRSMLKQEGLLCGEIWQQSGVQDGFKMKSKGVDENADVEIIRHSESRVIPGTNTNKIKMNFQVKNRKFGDTISTFTEYHYLRGFKLSEFQQVLEEAGFELLGFYSADSSLLEFSPAETETLRTFFISKGMNNKKG